MRRLYLGLTLALSLIGLTSCPSGGSSATNYGVVADFCKPCAGGSQCESKRCIEMEGIYGCTMYCYGADDCSEGFYCAWEAPEEEPAEGEEATPRGVCSIAKRCRR